MQKGQGVLRLAAHSLLFCLCSAAAAVSWHMLPQRMVWQQARQAAAAVSLVQTPAPTPAPSPAPNPSAAAAPAVSPTPTPEPTAAPDIPANAGRIRAETLRTGTGSGYILPQTGSIRNQTDLPDADLLAAVTTANLPFAVELNSTEPQVLILHTHATETYQTRPELYYDPDFTARTQNKALNMCAVGDCMAAVLNAAGINTLHDTTLHDFPSYTESYARSRATAQEYLQKYPSIKIILDVHRDALEDADGMRVKPLCQIDGQDTAQVMLIAGCDNGTTANLPNWRLNLRFAAAWQQSMAAQYPDLARPILCGYRFYNQDLTTGSLLIEIGGHANTLDEALRAGEYAARALAELLQAQN